MAQRRKLLSAELVEKARVTLNEIPDEVSEQVRILREKVQNDPELLNFRTDDLFLIRFLRAMKFSMDGAFALVKAYYKLRITYPTLYQKLRTSRPSNVIPSNYMGVLAKRDDFGRAVIYVGGFAPWDPRKFSMEDITAYFMLTLEKLVEDEDVQINGLVMIVNVKGLSLKHFPYITPAGVAQTLTNTVNSYPLRYEGIHFVNTFPLFNPIFYLIKPFFNKEMRNKIYIHGSDMSGLHQLVRPEILPQELGANAGPFDNSQWTEILEEHQETVQNDLKYGYQKEMKPF